MYIYVRSTLKVSKTRFKAIEEAFEIQSLFIIKLALTSPFKMQKYNP